MDSMLPNKSSSISQTEFQSFYNQTPSVAPDSSMCSNGGNLFMLFIEVLSTVVGFPSNAFVLYLLLRGGVEHSTSDIFKLSLTVMDTFYCLSLPLDPLSMYVISNNVVENYSTFIFGLNELGAPLLLTCVCLDRYVAVVHPIVFMKLRNGHHRLVAAILVWAVTVVYCVLMMVSTVSQKDIIFITPFVAAFLIILFCNVSVLCALRQSGPASSELHPVKKQAFRTVLTIFIIITISFLPLAVTYPFDRILPAAAFECYIYPFTYSFIILRAPLQGLFELAHARKLPCMAPDDLGDPSDPCPCC